ncbi:MAG: hypothetical protein HRT69_14890, partial [Flavobacteriaceae bacterium]|nr:hypothetical protein [Flavobacteriaceae bacterium]
MKKLFLLILLSLCALKGYTQNQGISYQAVILNPNVQELPGVDAQENILANSSVVIQFTIVNEIDNYEYQEYHETSTDKYGMINLLIGSGIPTSNNDFTDILWDGYSKKLKVDIDFSGTGSNFLPLSVQELSYMPQPVTAETAATIQANTDAIATNTTNIQSELDTTQTSAGLNADGTYSANGTTNYINTSTSVVSATEDLDAQVKTNEDAIAAN